MKVGQMMPGCTLLSDAISVVVRSRLMHVFVATGTVALAAMLP
jgi:hypothetical protein